MEHPRADSKQEIEFPAVEDIDRGKRREERRKFSGLEQSEVQKMQRIERVPSEIEQKTDKN